MNRLKKTCVGITAGICAASLLAADKSDDITGFRDLQFGSSVDDVEHALAHPKNNDFDCEYPEHAVSIFGRIPACRAVEDKVDFGGIEFDLKARFDKKTNVLDIIELENFFDASYDLFNSMVRGLKSKYGDGKAVSTEKRIAGGVVGCEETKTRVSNGSEVGDIFYKRLATYKIYLISRASAEVVVEYKEYRVCENLIPEWMAYKSRHPDRYRADEMNLLTVTYLRVHQSATFAPKDF
jgi:hypothetical protein